MSYQKLTIDQHRAMGGELHAIRGRIMAVGDQVLSAYPKGGRPARAYINALQQVDRLRHELDEAACRDHGEGVLTKWYYPGPDRSGQFVEVRQPHEENGHRAVAPGDSQLPNL